LGQLVSPEIEEYIQQHTSAVHPALSELDRHTHLHHLMPQMLSGPVQGVFLTLFCSAIQARKVLEIGTFTGYAAASMALGMPADGKLITLDINEELEETASTYFEKVGVSSKIEMRFGNATALIPSMPETGFDLVFIDADKDNYGVYYDLVWDKVREGGWILADNVLWSGKVVDKDPDTATRAIREFNDKVQQDDRVSNVILSVRDGLMLAQKMNN
jgi:predicted O-methyltransferase YrrM